MDGLTGNAEWRFQHHFPRLERSRQQLRGDIIRPRWEEEDRGVRMHLESREWEERRDEVSARKADWVPTNRPTDRILSLSWISLDAHLIYRREKRTCAAVRSSFLLLNVFHHPLHSILRTTDTNYNHDNCIVFCSVLGRGINALLFLLVLWQNTLGSATLDLESCEDRVIRRFRLLALRWTGLVCLRRLAKERQSVSPLPAIRQAPATRRDDSRNNSNAPASTLLEDKTYDARFFESFVIWTVNDVYL